MLQNTKTRDRYAQNTIISQVLHVAWFKNGESRGVRYKNYFNPISLETLALIFTLVSWHFLQANIL